MVQQIDCELMQFDLIIVSQEFKVLYVQYMGNR